MRATFSGGGAPRWKIVQRDVGDNANNAVEVDETLTYDVEPALARPRRSFVVEAHVPLHST